MADMNFKGLSQLNKWIDTFEPRLRNNLMRGGLRAGVKEILPVAKANIHNVSGQLAAGLKIGTRAKGTKVTAYMKATGPHGYIARFVEYGTKAHTIKAKDGGALAFAGGVYKSVEHPGAQPHPFARPALDQQASAAVIATGNYLKNRLATKHGIDTSHITVEGDE